MDRRPEGRLSSSVPDAPLPLLVEELERAGLAPEAWSLAAARLLPSVLLVPAFGLQALPLLARLGFAFVLSAPIVPALAALLPAQTLSLRSALEQIALGSPVAVAAASTLWVATMAGNVLDAVRGSASLTPFAGAGSEATPFGVLLSLLAAAAFLLAGGPAALLEALLVTAPLSSTSLLTLALSIARGIDVAVLVAAPLLSLTLLLEVARALAARAAGSDAVSVALAPARALLIVLFAALLLDRVVEGLTLWMLRQLGPS